MKTLQSFTISGTTCSTTQQHIPGDWNLQIYRAHHKGILGSRGIASPFLNLSTDGQISGQLQALATLTPKDKPPSTH